MHEPFIDIYVSPFLRASCVFGSSIRISRRPFRNELYLATVSQGLISIALGSVGDNLLISNYIPYQSSYLKRLDTYKIIILKRLDTYKTIISLNITCSRHGIATTIPHFGI